MMICVLDRHAPKGGKGLPSCSPPPPQMEIKTKNTDFVDTIISNVLRDLPFSRNQPLKSADDWYIRILNDKTNLRNLR
jgi:hypothetical protein